MMWFRRNYLPNSEDWSKWEASPLFASEESFAKAPRAWIAVCDLDVLRDEGIAYADKLRKAGVPVKVSVRSKAPHPIMAMDGVLESGRALISDACEAAIQMIRY